MAANSTTSIYPDTPQSEDDNVVMEPIPDEKQLSLQHIKSIIRMVVISDKLSGSAYTIPQRALVDTFGIRPDILERKWNIYMTNSNEYQEREGNVYIPWRSVRCALCMVLLYLCCPQDEQEDRFTRWRIACMSVLPNHESKYMVCVSIRIIEEKSRQLALEEKTTSLMTDIEKYVFPKHETEANMLFPGVQVHDIKIQYARILEYYQKHSYAIT